MATTYVQLGAKWDRDLGKAIELDGWGQVEEAREIYDSMATAMQREMTAAGGAWTEKQTQAVKKVMICLRLRSQVIRRARLDGINVENMKALRNVTQNLFKKDKKFPIDLGDVPEDDLKMAMGIVELTEETEVEEVVELVDAVTVAARPQRSRDIDDERLGGSGSPQMVRAGGRGFTSGDSAPASPAAVSAPVGTPQKKKGKTVLIHIERIGLKDFDVYVDPYVSVCVVSGGKTMEPWQDTKPSNERKDRHILFEDVVQLKSTYESILPGVRAGWCGGGFLCERDFLITFESGLPCSAPDP